MTRKSKYQKLYETATERVIHWRDLAVGLREANEALERRAKQQKREIEQMEARLEQALNENTRLRKRLQELVPPRPPEPNPFIELFQWYLRERNPLADGD